jgi:hypothetical protein
MIVKSYRSIWAKPRKFWKNKPTIYFPHITEGYSRGQHIDPAQSKPPFKHEFDDVFGNMDQPGPSGIFSDPENQAFSHSAVKEMPR